MTSTLTHHAVIQALTTIAQEQGDRINPKGEDGDGCYYTVLSGDHCIAGEAIIQLGGRVPAWGDENNINFIGALIADGFDIGLELSDDSISLLTACQMDADCSIPWGDVVRRNIIGEDV